MARWWLGNHSHEQFLKGNSNVEMMKILLKDIDKIGTHETSSVGTNNFILAVENVIVLSQRFSWIVSNSNGDENPFLSTFVHIHSAHMNGSIWIG